MKLPSTPTLFSTMSDFPRSILSPPLSYILVTAASRSEQTRRFRPRPRTPAPRSLRSRQILLAVPRGMTDMGGLLHNEKGVGGSHNSIFLPNRIDRQHRKVFPFISYRCDRPVEEESLSLRPYRLILFIPLLTGCIGMLPVERASMPNLEHCVTNEFMGAEAKTSLHSHDNPAKPQR